MQRAALTIPFFIILALCGCAASLPMASGERDALAKSFATNQDRANVYVYRDEVIPFGVALPIVLDGRTVGALGIKTYLLLAVLPGEHKLFCDWGSGTEVKLTTAGGRNYFVSVQANTDFLDPRPVVQVVWESFGKNAVFGCSLVEAKL